MTEVTARLHGDLSRVRPFDEHEIEVARRRHQKGNAALYAFWHDAFVTFADPEARAKNPTLSPCSLLIQPSEAAYGFEDFYMHIPISVVIDMSLHLVDLAHPDGGGQRSRACEIIAILDREKSRIIEAMGDYAPQ